jgi:hypothetical protein
VDGIFDVVDENDKIVGFYHTKTNSLNFGEGYTSIKLDDLEEIIEVCRIWKESNS